MIASGLETVPTSAIFTFLEQYFALNKVETVVVGQPVDLRGNMSAVEEDILAFIAELEKKFPLLQIKRFDERFTSRIASYYISQSGKNKKKRQEKGLIDKVSATLILQNYLEQIQK